MSRPGDGGASPKKKVAASNALADWWNRSFGSTPLRAGTQAQAKAAVTRSTRAQPARSSLNDIAATAKRAGMNTDTLRSSAASKQAAANRMKTVPKVTPGGVLNAVSGGIIPANGRTAPAKAAPKSSNALTVQQELARAKLARTPAKQTPLANEQAELKAMKTAPKGKPVAKAAAVKSAPAKAGSPTVSVGKGAPAAKVATAKPKVSTPKATKTAAKTATKAPAATPAVVAAAPVDQPAAQVAATPVDTGTAVDTGTSAPSKSLADYIADAQAALGPGQDYSGLKTQLTADTGAADSKIAAMYAALQQGTAASTDRINQAYQQSADSQRAAAADATKTTNAGYDSGAQAVTDRMNALGIGDAAKTLAANGSRAQDDQAAANSTISQRLASSLSSSAQMGASAQEMNERTRMAGQFAGLETRSGLQSQLVDGLAQLNQKQSASDADRRAQALQFALSQQSSDASAAQAAQDYALKASDSAFDQSYKQAQLGLDSDKLTADTDYKTGLLNLGSTKAQTDAAYKGGMLGVARGKAATDASYKKGTLGVAASKVGVAATKASNDAAYKNGLLGLGQQRVNSTNANNAAKATQAAKNQNDKVAISQAKQATADRSYQLAVRKLKDSNTNSLANRQQAAYRSALGANMSDAEARTVVKRVR